MRLFNFTFFVILGLLAYSNSYSQQNAKPWSLSDCLKYAKIKNIQVKQQELEVKLATYNRDKSKLSNLPDLNLNLNSGINIGRSINPTTNLFENKSYFFSNIIGNANVTLFNWFKNKNTISLNSSLLNSESEKLKQIQDEVGLNVISAFLRILIAEEQVEIYRSQIELSKINLKNIEKLLIAGSSNGLEVAQIKNQLVRDSSSYEKSKVDVKSSYLDLKVILNLDLNLDIKIEKPDDRWMTKMEIEDLSDHFLINSSLMEFPLIKSKTSNLEALKYNRNLIKYESYPNLNLVANSGSIYSSIFIDYSQSNPDQIMSFRNQLRNNFSSSIGLQISFPIFKHLYTSYNLKQADIKLLQGNLELQEAEQNLRREIQNAKNDVESAFINYNLATSAYDNGNIANNFAAIRFSKGLINSFELLYVQNDFFRTKLELMTSKYDFVFKKFILRYYIGKEFI